jgi:hypothetical protein
MLIIILAKAFLILIILMNGLKPIPIHWIPSFLKLRNCFELPSASIYFELPPALASPHFELPPALAGGLQIIFPFIGFSQILSYLFFIKSTNLIFLPFLPVSKSLFAQSLIKQ